MAEPTEWIDCSHPIDEAVIRVPFLPAPAFERVDDATLRATRVDIATHVGTHLEAPCHVFPDGASIDDYPPSRWISEGVVCQVDTAGGTPIAPFDLDPAVPVHPGDALLVRSGWEDRVGTDAYFEPPYLSVAAAEWIADQQVSWVGFDTPSPELPESARDDPASAPVHEILLGNDVLIGEHLTNLAPLAGRAVEIIALPLAYVGSDASQARIVARAR